MHRGAQLAAALWVLTTLSLGLAALRLYTRLRIVRFVGAEDHMFALTGLFLLAFTCFIQVAVACGLGESLWVLPLARSSDAIFWTYVANSFAITANAMAKLSMGLFLLRVVQIRWQRAALWALVGVTCATSAALVIMLWNQTTPVKASWDPLRTPGRWNVRIQPVSVGVGAWSSACDFFFAVFPWLFIFSLRMAQREKIMLAVGMSLGVIAGACGIVRTVVLSRVDLMDYTRNFVPYYAWAGAEIAVSMVCLGIPTLRPLYLKHRRRMSVEYHRGTQKHANELPRFAMVDRKPRPELDGSGHAPDQDLEARASSSSSCTATATSSEGKAPTKPPVAHTRRQSDPVDEILGLYDQGSAGAWAKTEVPVQRRQDGQWPL